MKTTDIVIDNFQKGIADSPHLGVGDMRNLNILSKPGVATLNFLAQMVTPAPGVFTFTAVAATDVITLTNGSGSSNLRWNGGGSTKRAVTLTSTGTLPAGLSLATTYWAIDITNLTLKLATTRALAEAGTPIDITGTGTGTHTITSVDMGLVKYFAKDSYGGNIFAQDHNGRVWQASSAGVNFYLLSGNTLTNANAQGLAVWQNYLFAFRSAKIDVYGDLTAAEASRAWTNDWATLNEAPGSSIPHMALVGQDDILYFADNNTTLGIPYIGSIQHIGTFVPATPGTYTFNNQKLDLPAYKQITGLDELGLNLMIGTSGREIYPWNRSSSTFDLPIIAAEDGIKTIRTLNNTLYFAAGVRGNIYKTVGSYTVLVRKLSPSITGIPYNAVSVGAIVGHKGKLFFTVECKLASGVYSIELETGKMVLEHRITTAPIDAATSTGTYGTAGPLTLPTLYSNGSEQLLFSWKDNDNTLYGIDSIGYSTYYFYPSYAGYFDSELIPVGSSQISRTLTNLIIELAKPLVSGEGVRVSYRKNLTDSFTTIVTFDFTTYGAVASLMYPAGIADADYVQLRVELTVAASATAAPELRAIILN